jgi:hypothetical protein
MKTNPKPRVALQSAFWDTSAIVPLCCLQAASAQARHAARVYAIQVVWWGTSVEAISSFNRLIREGYLSTPDSQQAFTRLNHLRQYWNAIQPSDGLRDLAEHLLGKHKLRAGDALQLASALVWCTGYPKGHCFIGGDNDLLDAADIEGFTVVRLH